MKLLVIGGVGYIGSHICRELLDLGHKVVVFDNLTKGDIKNAFPDAQFFFGDLLETGDLDRVMKNGEFDAVLHFAAYKAAGESMYYPEKYSRNNIIGALNLLNKMLEFGIKNLIFSSSAAVYGEPEYLPIDEKHRLKPENYYGYTKMAIEQNIEWFGKLKGLKYGILRYFNAAGYDVKGRITTIEKDATNLIPVAMEALTGVRKELEIFGGDYDTPDGTCIRDYIHTTDLADAHIRALNYIIERKENLTVNLGQNSGTSVLEVVKAIEETTGKKLPHRISGRRFGDPVKVIASNALAFEKLGWKPVYSDIQTIVETTYKLYLTKKMC